MKKALTILVSAAILSGGMGATIMPATSASAASTTVGQTGYSVALSNVKTAEKEWNSAYSQHKEDMRYYKYTTTLKGKYYKQWQTNLKNMRVELAKKKINNTKAYSYQKQTEKYFSLYTATSKAKSFQAGLILNRASSVDAKYSKLAQMEREYIAHYAKKDRLGAWKKAETEHNIFLKDIAGVKAAQK